MQDKQDLKKVQDRFIEKGEKKGRKRPRVISSHEKGKKAASFATVLNQCQVCLPVRI
jgi:hypothetical protein